MGFAEVGKWADIVIWKPAFFGVKPRLILKGGLIAMAAMGDPNASIPTPQPVHHRPMFGAFGGAMPRPRSPCVAGGLNAGIGERFGLRKQPQRGAQHPRRAQAAHGAQQLHPKMEVDAQTYTVRADGQLLTCEPMAHGAAAWRSGGACRAFVLSNAGRPRTAHAGPQCALC